MKVAYFTQNFLETMVSGRGWSAVVGHGRRKFQSALAAYLNPLTIFISLLFNWFTLALVTEPFEFIYFKFLAPALHMYLLIMKYK